MKGSSSVEVVVPHTSDRSLEYYVKDCCYHSPIHGHVEDHVMTVYY